MHPSNLVALITARGGSKGLYRKNIRNLCGKPLIAYSIDAAFESSRVDRVITSTEDPEIKKISIDYGSEVIDRPSSLASDTALHCDVLVHCLEVIHNEGDDPTNFVLLQPTSPLRTGKHIDECFDHFINEKLSSTFSVTQVEHHPYKAFIKKNNKIIPLFGSEYLNLPRQKLPEIYRQNGAIYILNTKKFLKQRCLYIEPFMPYIMNNADSVDIDDEIDLQICEYIIKNK